jgi:hypothetical protein
MDREQRLMSDLSDAAAREGVEHRASVAALVQWARVAAARIRDLA